MQQEYRGAYSVLLTHMPGEKRCAVLKAHSGTNMRSRKTLQYVFAILQACPTKWASTIATTQTDCRQNKQLGNTERYTGSADQLVTFCNYAG